MKAKPTISALVLFLAAFLPARAQVVVMDPTQIAASATNAAQQIDYMVYQLGELAEVHDKLQSVHGYIEDVFGEDGAGGKTLSVLRDLGTLDRLTKTYNATVKQTERYIGMMKEMEHYGLSDANTVLGYMNSLRDNIELGVTTAKHILSTLGFSRKEKKDELEKIIADMEQEMEKTRAMVEIEVESTLFAEGLAQFTDYMDSMMDPGMYVKAMDPYGTMDEAGRGTMGLVEILLILMTVILIMHGYVIICRGGLEGDPVHENIFLRVGAGLLIGLGMVELLAEAAGINL